MKRTNKAFTVVELIIVIAVIGILAAILILALPRAIDEAHEKSALSDARNALTEAHLDATGDIADNLMAITEKYNKIYVFGGQADNEELTPFDANPLELHTQEEILQALLDLNILSAPIGYETVAHNDEFDNVVIYSGVTFANQRTDIQKRIDVEVGKRMNVPAYGVLNMKWTVDNILTASISDGKINGKAVGQTTLRASCGNLRLEYPLYIGKKAVISTFSELKAEAENTGDDSVFIYCDRDCELCPDKSELPLVIPEGKHVALCSGSFKEPEGEYGIRYNITKQSDCVNALIINKGGILAVNNVGVTFDNTLALQENQDNYVRMDGDIIENIDGGIVRVSGMYGITKNTAIYTFGLFAPSLLQPEKTADEMRQQKGYCINNVDGDVIVLGCEYIDSICNGEKGTLTIEGDNDNSRVNLSLLENRGVVNKLKNVQFSCLGRNDLRDNIILNTGTIYNITDCEFLTSKGTYAIIHTDGMIHRINECVFYENAYTEEKLAGFEDISDEIKQKYREIRSVPFIMVENGRIGKITDVTAGTKKHPFTERFITHTEPGDLHCIVSGKFLTEPHPDYIAEGSICLHDVIYGWYIVEVENYN